MSTKDNSLSQNWKCPNELLKLQRLKQRKKQLAARLTNNNNNNNNNNVTKTIELTETEKERLLEAKIAKKRTNPFAKPSAENCKKYRTEEEDTVLDLLEAATTTVPAEKESDAPKATTSNVAVKPFNNKDFANFLQQQSAGEEDEVLDQQQQTKHLPMDWSLKTRARLFCRTELPATTLKTSQMASGLTSFVRCIDPQNSNSGLDISPATCFNAATFYWQHPHIPWATLYPRNSKNNTNLNLGEVERQALLEDWDLSFRGLFHLLRARQCAYFYVCANTFTVLFRAAGTAGCDEMHALITPTTRGIRSMLRQEGIEYTMPLKRENNHNKSDNTNAPAGFEDMAEEDEVEEDEWLESLGVDEKEIKRIQSTATRQAQTQEMLDDFSDHSLLFIEGVECQGFFSFLLNAKSSISSTGRLAGVPPTLLAPVAFPKATMQQLSTRSNLVRMDGVDYCSIEVKGVVLPSFLPHVCHLLGDSKDTFSVTLASSLNTLAFSKATQRIVENAASNEQAKDATSLKEEGRGVFGQENLSDCGLLAHVVKSLCRTGVQAVTILERVCYDREHGYAWS